MISFASRPIWRSRKPFGIYHIADAARTGASGSNPKGWFFNPAIDIAGDPESLRTAANAYAVTSVGLLDSMHAQAAVFWQLEGGGTDVPFYLGDPRKIFDLNPEWLHGMTDARTLEGSIIKDFLDHFTTAGYKIGVTIRPHDFNFDTLEWETSANPAYTLWQKARFAYDRLGARIFYCDTNNVEPLGGAFLPAIVFKKLHRLLPDCLFVTEQEEGGYYEYCAPYGDFNDAYMPTPAYVRDYYPNAFRFVNVGGCSDAQLAALLSSPSGRDGVAVDAWFSNPTIDKIVTGLAEGGTDGG